MCKVQPLKLKVRTHMWDPKNIRNPPFANFSFISRLKILGVLLSELCSCSRLYDNLNLNIWLVHKYSWQPTTFSLFEQKITLKKNCCETKTKQTRLLGVHIRIPQKIPRKTFSVKKFKETEKKGLRLSCLVFTSSSYQLIKLQ